MNAVPVWHGSCIITMQAYRQQSTAIREVDKMTVAALELLVEISVIVMAGIIGFGPLVIGA